MSQKNILSLLSSLLEELPTAELKVAKTILENPSEILHMTAHELGAAAQSSAATVIRLCKRLNVDSFTSLKVYISSEINEEKIEDYSDFKEFESLNSIVNKVISNANRAMEDTQAIIDESVIKSVIDIISKSQTIITYGVGSSSLVAANIAQKFRRIGVNCYSFIDGHQVATLLSSNPLVGTFIGVSNSGESEEVIKLAKIANANEFRTISLTRFGKNSLESVSDINLYHARANEGEFRSAATSSLNAQFLVVDILFYYYASMHYEPSLKNIRNSYKYINEFKKQ